MHSHSHSYAEFDDAPVCRVGEEIRVEITAHAEARFTGYVLADERPGRATVVDPLIETAHEALDYDELHGMYGVTREDVEAWTAKPLIVCTPPAARAASRSAQVELEHDRPTPACQADDLEGCVGASEMPSNRV